MHNHLLHRFRVPTCDRIAAVVVLTFIGLLIGLTTHSPTVGAARLHLVDADVRNHPNDVSFAPRCNAKLKGEIFPGDYEVVRRRLEELAARLHWADEGRALDFSSVSRVRNGFLALCLSSPGGDLVEALKISSLFLNWMTVIEADDACISACAILFMRGLRRDGVYAFNGVVPGRFLHYRGKLGFHAPRLTLPREAPPTISTREATDAYARALRTVRAIVQGFMHDFSNLCETTRVGRELVPDGSSCRDFQASPHALEPLGMDDDRIPVDLLMTMLTVPPEEVVHLTRLGEAMNWGIEVFGFKAPRQLSQRMLMSACLNVQHYRCLNDKIRSPGSYCSEEFLHRHNDPKAFQVQKLRLHPPSTDADPLTVQVFSVASASGGGAAKDKPCEVRAVWHSERLIDLEIDTFNGRFERRRGEEPLLRLSPDDIERFRELATPAISRASEDYVFSGDEAFRLRIWKMLPASAELAGLSGDAWKDMHDDKGFFDLPAR